MALDPCVKSVICTLSLPVLNATKALVEGTIVQLQALLNQLQARSITLGIQLVPVELARDAANAVLQEALSVSNLLPLGIIEGCADLGSIQQGLTAGVEQATAAVNDFADDATRLLSLQVELDLQIEQLNAEIQNAQDLVAVIDECIQEGSIQ